MGITVRAATGRPSSVAGRKWNCGRSFNAAQPKSKPGGCSETTWQSSASPSISISQSSRTTAFEITLRAVIGHTHPSSSGVGVAPARAV
jgi:hypothetical protein